MIRLLVWMVVATGVAQASNAVFTPLEGKNHYACKRFLRPAPQISVTKSEEGYRFRFFAYLRDKHSDQPWGVDPRALFENFNLRDSGDIFSVEFLLKADSCLFEEKGSLFSCEEGFSWLGTDPEKAPIEAVVVQVDGKDGKGHFKYHTQRIPLNYVKLSMKKFTGEKALNFKTGKVEDGRNFISHQLNWDFTGIREPHKQYGVFITHIDYTENDCRQLAP